MRTFRDFLLLSVLLLTVSGIGLGTVYALEGLGVPMTVEVAQAAPQTPSDTLEWSTTPAYELAVKVLNTSVDGLEPQSAIRPLSSSAVPASCLAPVPGPAGSLDRVFKAESGQVELALTAYPAGVGAVAFKELVGAIGDCGTSSVSNLGSFGVESVSISTDPAGVATPGILWRRGDLLLMISGQGDLASWASTFDAAADSLLGPVCADQSSAIAQASRNPWFDRDAYKQFTVPVTVSSTEPPLPTLPPSTSAPTDATPVEAVPVPSPDLAVTPARVPATPSYPVWPPLPTAVAYPHAPAAPAPALTSKTFQVPSDDLTGPGCGWRFTGSAPPLFDQAAADEVEASKRADAQDALTKDAARWQSEVLQYWKDYASYQDQVKAYNAYAQEVASVRSAWDVIAAQWAVYNRDLSVYNMQVAARDKFLSDQAEAQAAYDQDVAACAAPAPTPTPTPSEPAPTPTPSETTPAPTPTPPPAFCPPPRPLILDQSAPEVGPAPTPPPDPRPGK